MINQSSAFMSGEQSDGELEGRLMDLSQHHMQTCKCFNISINNYERAPSFIHPKMCEMAFIPPEVVVSFMAQSKHQEQLSVSILQGLAAKKTKATWFVSAEIHSPNLCT